MKDGYGKQKWANGSQYEGYWQQNKSYGRGKLTHSSGDIYDGEWSNDKANGFGIYYHVNGAKYEGQWKDDKQHGNGVEIWPDHAKHEGLYVNGQKEGKGYLKFSDKSEYEGEFKNNVIEGNGIYRSPDGRVYEGDWIQNKMHGKGNIKWPDGKYYEGEYFEDKKHGLGVFVQADGKKYIEQQKMGKQHGFRMQISKGQQDKIGVWEEGKITNCTSAFVFQDDILLETLTVRETIEFAAKLKLIQQNIDIQQKVNQIVQKLKLENCQNSFVGGVYVKGISIGERKRTNIGIELINNPELIILDEPTTGLDNFSSLQLINILQQLSTQDGKTIIFTINQPNSEIFQQLDRLLLLQDGQTVYQGKADQIVQYLQNNDYEFPQFCNPADFFMFILNSKDISYQLFSKSAYDQNIQNNILQEIENFCIDKQEKIIQIIKTNPFIYETKVIAHRAFLNFKRQPLLLKSKIIQLIILCFLVSSLWWFIGQDQPSIDSKDQNQIVKWVSNITGLMFFISIAIFLNIMITYVQLFPKERNLFLKEENSNTYRVYSYFYGKLIVEIPYVILYPILFNSIIYWLTSQRTEGFGISCLILVVLSLAGNGLGLMIGSIFTNNTVVTAISPMLLYSFALFAGFYINLSKMPSWISWIQYISPFRYSLNALMINQLNGLVFVEINYDPIKTFDFDFSIWEALGILIGLALFMNIISLLFLKLSTQKLN
ncbi:hypothetical protein IMG5_124460 [Ichthyophthirius multifiliis]|uniref:ABC transporter domain-containing protein n=1 Tax=Ichthyophthirius multifiliis TaxID=5932 RepID=G0QVL1_ICHMU|nr:hypothetical protein IMG5_124460 [Ichthyophthirius multifiliis]EGR30734.1 hypothetical protein IMG5_124460 [Ichthyophthirius multifiliis]|eukprot:XP_004032321.1 hypothetical protein IMG5_124460 [Ichthyophthirius multifiliis]